MEKWSKRKRKVDVKLKKEMQEGEGKWWHDGPDSAICLPYFLYDDTIVLRMEIVPAWAMDTEKYFLTCISGTIEGDETPEDCLRRELKEEAGIVLNENYPLTLNEPLKYHKGYSGGAHWCILPLDRHDFQQTWASTDGSELEKASKPVWVNVRDINNINPEDFHTHFMISELKKYLNF